MRTVAIDDDRAFVDDRRVKTAAVRETAPASWVLSPARSPVGAAAAARRGARYAWPQTSEETVRHLLGLPGAHLHIEDAPIGWMPWNSWWWVSYELLGAAHAILERVAPRQGSERGALVEFPAGADYTKMMMIAGGRRVICPPDILTGYDGIAVRRRGG